VPSPCIILKRSLASDITRDVSSACQLITCKCIIWTSGARSPTNRVSELQDTISPTALSIYLASNGRTCIPTYRLLRDRVHKYTRARDRTRIGDQRSRRNRNAPYSLVDHVDFYNFVESRPKLFFFFFKFSSFEFFLLKIIIWY